MAKNILDFARRSNITTLDTASGYGNSEQVLGDVNTCDFKIVTKTRNFNQAVIGNKEINLLTSDFNKSLKLLKQKSVYGVLVHNANDLLKPGADKIIKQLQILKQKGQITKIGVSIYSEEQLQKIIDSFDIDLVQLPFNILDKRLKDSGILNNIFSQGIEIHARSVFLQGLFLDLGRIPTASGLRMCKSVRKYKVSANSEKYGETVGLSDFKNTGAGHRVSVFSKLILFQIYQDLVNLVAHNLEYTL